MVLIVNSGATGVSPELRDQVAGVLRRSHAVRIVDSASPEESTARARCAAAAEVAVVAALGGDGTARSVAEGIGSTGTALGCLPAGSRNVFARMIGTPGNPITAAERLAGPTRPQRRVDLGLAAGRHFLFAASVGLSAHANEQLNRRPRVKARFGALYGAGAALGAAAAYLIRPPLLRIRAGGRSTQAVSLIIQNARPLTYVGDRPLELCEQVSLTSGTISIAALRRLAVSDLLGIPARLVLRATEPATAHRHVEEIGGVARGTVEALGSRALPVDLDGDYAGSFERIDVGVAPGALIVTG